MERWWGVNSSEDSRHCSVLYACKYFANTVRLITDDLFPVNNDANVRRKMYMCGSVAQARATDSFFYKLTSILLNFNMWECRMKKKIPCIATVRSEFFYLLNNIVSNSGKLSELAAHSNVSACRRWRAGEQGAAEDGGAGSGPSGSVTGAAIFGRVRTRSELEKLINSSIRPLYIKQEALDHEAAGDFGSDGYGAT